jgi:hypothetical protein
MIKNWGCVFLVPAGVPPYLEKPDRMEKRDVNPRKLLHQEQTDQDQEGFVPCGFQEGSSLVNGTPPRRLVDLLLVFLLELGELHLRQGVRLEGLYRLPSPKRVPTYLVFGLGLVLVDPS